MSKPVIHKSASILLSMASGTLFFLASLCLFADQRLPSNTPLRVETFEKFQFDRVKRFAKDCAPIPSTNPDFSCKISLSPEDPKGATSKICEYYRIKNAVLLTNCNYKFDPAVQTDQLLPELEKQLGKSKRVHTIDEIDGSDHYEIIWKRKNLTVSLSCDGPNYAHVSYLWFTDPENWKVYRKHSPNY